MLLEKTNSIGRLPSSELWDRFRCNKPVRLTRDGEMPPLRPLAASKTSVTVPSLPQMMHSHLQQSVPSTHESLRPPLPSGMSPSRKLMRELLSCSVQELVGEAKKSRRTAANPRKVMDKLLLFLGKERSSCMVFS